MGVRSALRPKSVNVKPPGAETTCQSSESMVTLVLLMLKYTDRPTALPTGTVLVSAVVVMLTL